MANNVTPANGQGTNALSVPTPKTREEKKSLEQARFLAFKTTLTGILDAHANQILSRIYVHGAHTFYEGSTDIERIRELSMRNAHHRKIIDKFLDLQQESLGRS